MGRYSTGAIITKEAIRLELSYLLRQGYLKKGSPIIGTLSWSNGSTMQINSSLDEGYIRLTYSFRAGGDGDPIQKDYFIYLTYIPSNLGKGHVSYLICPSSGRRARVLYMCYGSPLFKCRKAYTHRIYYQSQQSSKLNYHNDRYWDLEKEIESIKNQIKRKSYRGKTTRLRKRLQQLEAKQDYHDAERWNHAPQSVLKSLSGRALFSELKRNN